MQYKTLINPSFLVLMLDVQDHLKAGWEIDPNNLPANTFTYYEVNLVKDEFAADIVEAFKDTPDVVHAARKPAGRPAKVKQ